MLWVSPTKGKKKISGDLEGGWQPPAPDRDLESSLLFSSMHLWPKSSKTIARSQIKCASCEICSYHLGLESPYLSPPFKDMYICDVCNRTYHWQCLLKTSCCNATEREAIDANGLWACPACINLKPKWKEKSYPLLSEKRECGGFMEPSHLGAKRTTKHVWKLQAEPQNLWRANHCAKLISARTRWTPKWSSKTRVLCHPRRQCVPTL